MFHKDEWLSQYFKGGAYSYSKSHHKDCQEIQQGFVYTKVPSENQDEINTLIKDGFKLVEVLVLFEQKNPVANHTKPENNIGFVKSEDEQGILEIAKNAFLTSRLYQDSRIPHAVASRIKEDWVANYFAGQRGDNLIVARVDGRVAGFLLLINKTTIDLIAVSPSYHRRGIASSMIGFANQTLGLLNAGTQLNNPGSIAMYEKCGFFMKYAYFVLHKFYGMV